MKFDPKRGYYNTKTREFAIQTIDGVYQAVGYPTHFCVKVHPCKTGIRLNMGCNGGEFTKEQWKLCPGRWFWYDPKREMSQEEIEQMRNEENGWIDIKENFLGENEDGD